MEVAQEPQTFVGLVIEVMSTFNQGNPTVSHVISSSNIYLVGNTSSGNALSVQQLGAGNVFSFSNSSGRSNVFVMNNLGQVGIGTANPSNFVHIHGPGATTRIQTSTTSDARLLFYNSAGTYKGSFSYSPVGGYIYQQNSDMDMIRFYDGASGVLNLQPTGAGPVTICFGGNPGYNSSLYLGSRSNAIPVLTSYTNGGGAASGGTISINRFHTDTTYQLSLNNTTFSGSVMSVTAFPYDGNENTGNILRLGTANGDDTGFTPYLMVKSRTGYVGIGTATVSAGLQYWGGASSNTTNGAPGTGGVIIGSDATAGSPGDYSPVLHFRQSWYTQGSGSVTTGGIAGYKTAASGAFGGGLAFLYCGNGATTLSQGMTLTDTGRVGIGTTNPGALLHVYGTYSYWGTYQSESTSRQNGTVIQGASWNPVNAAGVTYYAPNFSIYAGSNPSVGALWNFTSRPTHYASDLILTAGDCNDLANNGSGPVNAYGGNLYLQGGIAFCGGGTAAYPYVAGDVVIQTGATNAGNTDQTRYERARIKGGNGYVGIGIASPSYLLHVNGTFASTGRLFGGVNAYSGYVHTFSVAGTYLVTYFYGNYQDINICGTWIINVANVAYRNPIGGNPAGYLTVTNNSNMTITFGQTGLPAGYNNTNYNCAYQLLL